MIARRSRCTPTSRVVTLGRSVASPLLNDEHMIAAGLALLGILIAQAGSRLDTPPVTVPSLGSPGAPPAPATTPSIGKSGPPESPSVPSLGPTTEGLQPPIVPSLR
jgi:hypothetical protein